MPTGYTTKLCEGEQSFDEFVLLCARAFGACVMQRDDPGDELPKLPSGSSYYTDNLAHARENLANFSNMTYDEKIAYGSTERTNAIERNQKHIKKTEATRLRLVSMLEKVNEWTPPSEDHNELKKFMIDQLDQTIKFDGTTTYYEDAIGEAERLTPMDFYNKAIRDIERSIKHCSEQIEKEKTVNDSRTEWILKLYESLGRQLGVE